MKVFSRFKEFLREYRIIAISVAFIIGMASLSFVQSIVNDLFLPLIRPLISNKALIWEDITWTFGSISLRVGSFLSALFSLLLILLLLYLFVDKVLHWKPKK